MSNPASAPPDPLAAIAARSRTGADADFRPHQDWEPNDFCVARFGAPTIAGADLARLIRSDMPNWPNGLDLRGIAIDGDLELSGLDCAGLLSFRECFFTGNVVIRDAHLGPTSFAGSVIRGVCDLRGSAIAGFLFLRFGFVGLGGVLLRETRIETTLNCERASFHCDYTGAASAFWRKQLRGECFAFERGRAETLIWRDMATQPAGIVNLRHSTVAELRDEPTSVDDIKRDWPAHGQLHLHRFEYATRSNDSADALLAWLRLQDTAQTHHPLSAHEVLLRALDRDGSAAVANAIQRDKEWLLLRRETNWFGKLLRWVYCVGSDGGTSIGRALLFAIALFASSVVGIDRLAESRGFQPSAMEVRTNACYAAAACADPGWRPGPGGHRIPATYPAFNSIGFALDAFVPGIDYGFARSWEPATAAAEWSVAAIITAGLLSFTLIAICVTGVIRRRGE